VASLARSSDLTRPPAAPGRGPQLPPQQIAVGDEKPGFEIEERLELAGLAAPYRAAILADTKTNTLLVS